MDSFLIDVPMPSMGATVSELTVIDVRTEPGATLAKGQKIAELESDKSVFEYEAPCDGTLVAIYCRAGDIVQSGRPFIRISTTDESQRHLAVNGASAPAPEHARPHPKPAAPAPAAAAPAQTPGLQWTPRALKIAQEAGLDPATISGIAATGPGGRISGDDITGYLQLHLSTSPAAQAAGPLPTPSETVCIAGVGYAVPKNVMSNCEILKKFPDRTEEEIIKLTGIRERRYASEDESATDLAAIAANHALRQAGIEAKDLDGVIMATIIPDQPVPSMASRLAQRLGVHHPLAFDLNAACAGWLYALEVGRSFIRTGTAKRVLVVTAELLSRITNPRDKETAFLFGDGAGAAVLTDAPNGHRLHRMALSGDADLYTAIQRTGGGALKPVPQASGCDLDHFYLQMNGAAVFKAAVVAFGNEIEDTLKRHNLKPEDINWIVPHQANERILKAVSKRVGIPYEKFIVTIAKYGNTSAASVSMALGYAAEEGVFSAGDKIIFCSVGAGLTFAGGLLIW
ncbi:3-oxoacyl-[acyl-carrier-protein] synthase 3 [mine drainage metagenome]|uniref:3-oxoacyl-[acyl-carrier-protein] synthase 3 n=1 Tax=mine drainage metagenome TaxID=410659 RepID=A0A1J5TB99_9ZZZZ